MVVVVEFCGQEAGMELQPASNANVVAAPTLPVAASSLDSNASH